MTAMARNIFLMSFSAFVLNTAILAHADAGYFADNLQKIKEYLIKLKSVKQNKNGLLIRMSVEQIGWQVGHFDDFA